MFRNTTDLCILLLCTKTLLNSFIRSNSFGGPFGIFLNIRSHHLQTGQFNFSSLLVWMSFILFSFLIILARTFNMLNRSVNSGHPCLVLDIGGKAFNLSPLSMMLFGGLSYMDFIMLRCFPSIFNFWSVYNERILNFVKFFSASIEMFI